MLPKGRRIQRYKFKSLLASNKRFNSTYFTLYLSLQKEDKPSLFSFSISKKTSKSAVIRNKYRRRGYSVIKNHLNSIKPGFMCFFVFKKGLNNLKYGEMENEIVNLLSISGVIL